MSDKKISVFGGTGFIGSKFCELYKDEIYLEPRDSIVPKYDDVLYLISTTDNYNVLTDVHLDINTNLTKLMDILPNVKGRFTFISSWFVYGDGPIPAQEDQPCNPKGFYSITKKCAEDLIISYCKTFCKEFKILRLCNVYGPNDKGRGKKKNALQFLIDEMKSGKDINLYYGGNFIRDYMHVSDVCKAIKLCIEKGNPNEIINIGSDKYVFRDLIDFVKNKIGYKGMINTIEATDFHKLVQVKDHYMECSKLKNMGFIKEITIEDGLTELL